MFAVEVYAAVRQFIFIDGNSRREAARVFGLNGDSCRLKSSRNRRGRVDGRAEQNQATADPHDPETGEILPT
ncbi:hypothetical protein ACYQR9_21570 [Methylobacterium sp. CM6241]